MSKLYPLVLLITLCGSIDAAPPKLGTGPLTQLDINTSTIEFNGVDDSFQLVVTATHQDAGISDQTGNADYRVSDPEVVAVSDTGFITPIANGQCEVIVESHGKSARMSVRVQDLENPTPINFANEIIPVLTKLGCNNGGCHGKADGQNGFKLSLLGFDADEDYEAIVHEARGRRIELASPAHGLLILKPTGQLGHGGGKPLEIGSPDYQLLTRWISSGAPFGNADDPKVVGISVRPDHRILARDSHQQVQVVAHLDNNTQVDVTRRAEFKSNDPQIVDASKHGLIQTGQHFGEGSVMVRYLGHVALFRATIPMQPVETEPVARIQPTGFVDELVLTKLDQLGLEASQLCTDGEFLRRASIDITGSLPTVAEARRFLADTSTNKRAKLIDDLLDRPEYASYFTMKWSDILRVRGGVREPKEKAETARKAAAKKKITPLDKPARRADVFRDWILQSITTNKPYDQFVREIIVTTGDTSGPDAPPASLWYLELKTPQGLVEDAAQAFLGTRIQCAQCHHHPFERWSQSDYWGMASFFARVQWQTAFDKNGKRVKEMKPVRLSEAGRMGQFIGFNSDGKLTDPNGNEYLRPRPLGEAPLTPTAEQDSRKLLVDWMVSPGNPFFAKAVVNRYWGHFFRHAIVEPLDDLRVTNPASNPELLDALATDFVQHKFDLKHLIRTICNSHAYRLSSTPSRNNAADRRNYARYLPTRLSAEVLLDAVDRVIGTPTQFTAMGGYKFPLGTRAIELPDAYISNYFLKVFGRPERKSACDCEREPSVTLAQRAHLLNGMSRKMTERAAKLVTDKRDASEIIDELYLATFTRLPSNDERKTLVDYVSRASERDKQQAWYDVVWSLLNSKEFSFNH